MAIATPVLPKLVGERVKRREDPRLIQGRGTYVDDIKIAGMQHLAFKRSDIAHGRITSIDTSAAEAMDGVEAVFTGAQIAEVPRRRCRSARRSRRRRIARSPSTSSATPASRSPSSSPPIATSRATPPTRSSSSYDTLPAVVDPELAMTGKPAVIHKDFPEQPRGGARAERHRRRARRLERSTTPRSTRRSPTPRS